MTTIDLTVDDRLIPVELNDCSTARDLVSLLPLTVSFEDYGGQEKVGTLPERLTMDGVPSSADPEENDLGYYAPNRKLVLYYSDVGRYDGIVRLGRISPADMAFLRDHRHGFTAELTTH